MVKFLSFCFCLFFALPVVAEQVEEKEPDAVVVREVAREFIELPVCNDAILQAEVKEFINQYYKEHNEPSAVFRRKKYFVLHNLTEFDEESLGNYKTERAKPISDVIVDLKMNHNVPEANMRLCKNQSKYEAPSKIFLLLYAENKEIKVRVINLQQPEIISEPLYFSYQSNKD